MRPYISTMIVQNAVDITLQCTDGIILAAQLWKIDTGLVTPPLPSKDISPKRNKRRILCLHGWMDNCRSFHHFAPQLLKKLHDDRSVSSSEVATELVAIDFPGHGWSSHKSTDGPPILLTESIYYVAEAIQQLQWMNTDTNQSDVLNSTSATTSIIDQHQDSPKFTLVGHSMGAAISCLYASTFPEQIDKLVLLEVAGPLARESKDFSKNLRQSVERRLLGNGINKVSRIYPTLSLAVSTRMKTAAAFPGNQYISELAATELVLRGTKAISADGTREGDGTSDPNAIDTLQGYQFRHDTRLQWPSIQYCTPEQVDTIYQNIQCPVALLLANDGWPFDSVRNDRMIQTLHKSNESLLSIHKLPGSHHFHADPDTADAVVDTVSSFLTKIWE